MSRPLTNDEKISKAYKQRQQNVQFVPQAEYGRPSTNVSKIDKSSIVWRDFLNGVRRRKRLLNHIRTVAVDENDLSTSLKRLMMELRQLTLKVIEDALEIEYRSQFGDAKAPVRAGTAMQLPPLSSFRGLEGKEDLYMLSDIITDTDDLFHMPNIQAFLPLDFPSARNPFILGKDVNGLASLEGPRPEPGNISMELKALEFLRYKRAAKALLRAEAQVMNKIPLNLEDVEHLWQRLPVDRNDDVLVRTVITLLIDDNVHPTERGPELRYMIDEALHMQPVEFLKLLNNYPTEKVQYNIELLACIRHLLKDVCTKNFTDIATAYLYEWVKLVLGSDVFTNAEDDSSDALPTPPIEKSTGKSPYKTTKSSSMDIKDRQRAGAHQRSLSPQKDDDVSTIGSPSPSKARKKKITVTGSQKRDFGGGSASLSKAGSEGEGNSPEALNRLMGIKSKKSKKKSSVSTGDEGVSSDTLDALKYEIIKMQQELLRRKILDPKAYGLVPGKVYGPTKNDVTEREAEALAMTRSAASSNGGTRGRGKKEEPRPVEYIAVEDSDETGNIRKDLDPLNALVLLKETLPVRFSKRGVLEVLVNSTKSTVFTQYRRPVPINSDDFSVGSQGDDGSIGSVVTEDCEEQVVVFNSLNRLLFDRLTGLQISTVVESSDKTRRNQLNNFMEISEKLIDRNVDPHVMRQQIAFQIDMVVVHEELVSGNIAVDVIIERSEESPGLLIRAIPKEGSLYTAEKMDHTPITIFLHDRELLVLLINQRGLYTLALAKWSCLEMVARWILGRLHINRIPFPVPESRHRINVDQTGREALVSSTSDGMVTKTYFEVDVDRSVDIAQEVKNHWNATNVPSLNDVHMNTSISAVQELEMLIFTINIELKFVPPSVVKRRSEEKEAARAYRARLIKFTTPYDDDYTGDKVIENTWDIPFETDPEVETHVLTFTMGLTGHELLMFGAGESLDEHKVNKKRDQSYQANLFLRNVMSRMSIAFKGSKTEPHDEAMRCTTEANWELKYNRKLLRDVRTVTGGIMMVTALGYGDEILFESKPTDNMIYTKVGSKLFGLSELEEIVDSEGWSLEVLEPGNRVTLAHRIAEKLKVILHEDKHKLEFYTFPETRMIEICTQATINKPEMCIGMVEITSQITLNDLRVVINHELDRDLIPKLYRFIYKGGPCSLKQEPFRRAWECLPKCMILTKTTREINRANDTVDKSKEAVEKAVLKAKKAEEEARKKNTSGKKLVPVPIPTLCKAQEGVYIIYTRHDMGEHLQPGDILRIGHIESSDFAIPFSFARVLELSKEGAEMPDGSILDHDKPVKAIPIDPYFLTYGESDLFIKGNFPFSELIQDTPRVEDISVQFDAEGNSIVQTTPEVDPETLIDERFQYIDEILKREEDERIWREKEDEKEGVERKQVSSRVLDGTSISPSKSSLLLESQPSVTGSKLRDDSKELEAAESRKESQKSGKREPGKVFKDLWIWKCIPRSEDIRPKWRRMYDDGDVKYTYTYRDHKDHPKIFNVVVPLKLMEEFCRDVRCADMTLYHQRVDEVPRIGIDYYTELTYEHVVTSIAPPSVSKGVDEAKFIAFIKSINVFPDMHKAQRLTQLSHIFYREVNGKEGDETYVNYYGFCNLIQEVCLIRYPAGMFDVDGPEAPENNIYAAPGDGPPVPPPPPLPSSSIAKTSSRDDGDNNSVGSVGSASTKSMIPLSAAARRPSIATIQSSQADKKARPKGKKKGMGQSKKNKLKGLEETLLSQVDPKHAAMAYRKFVTDYFILIPDVSEGVWEQAKVFAMEKEALRYAAVTRLCAAWRRGQELSRFKVFKSGLIQLQSYARKRQSRARVERVTKRYMEDWLFRIRYHSAILAQSSIRRYLERCRFLKKTAKIRERELIVAKAKRQRSAKLRQREKKGIVFKQIRRINGVMVMLLLRRKDQRNYSNDYSMRLEVYNPNFQIVNVFIIEESDLRKYMRDILQVDVLSVGDLLNKKNLERVISVRLLCRLSKRVGDPPKMILSRQALGQKGPKVMTRGRNIQGEMFACTLFETGYDIVVQCYHLRTSIIFPCTILHSALTDWVTEEYVRTCTSDIEKQMQPPLLRSENKSSLHQWIVNNIVIDKRHGRFQVMFKIQLKKSVKMESIIKIQSVFRMALERSKVPGKVDQYLLKVQNSVHDPYNAYYMNIYTGASDWYKTPLLKEHQDLPTQPYYRWVLLPYSEQPLYVNPLTGKYTFLTPDKAARMMQSMVRNWMLRPFRVTFDTFRKGRAFEKEAEASYAREPRRLAFVLNYALLSFCVKQNNKLARQLILEALELADTNPLATRLHALFLLSTVEAPAAVSRAHAMGLLADAARRDPQAQKFSGALQYFFKYGCYRHPRHCHMLLNLGLAEYYVFKNMSNAEVCLRRAVAIAPFDDRVMDNWKRLRDDFPEKKLVYRPRGRLHKITNEVGGKKTTIHGRPVTENPAWAGWVFVEKDIMFKDEEAEYWYNPGTGESSKHIPEDWHREWELRAYRSTFEGEKDGLEYYYDPATATYFQRHVLTDTYQ